MSDHDHDRTQDPRSGEGDTRYGQPDGPRGSGHQESKKPERKETEGGFVSRQGGDQSRDEQGRGDPPSR